MARVIIILLFLSLAACANDKQTGGTCGPFDTGGVPPKHLVLQVGIPRANGMSVQYCPPNCYVANDSQGEVQWCEN